MAKAFGTEYDPKRIKTDKDYALMKVSENGHLLSKVGADFQKDADIISAAIKKERLALRYADPEFQAKLFINNPNYTWLRYMSQEAIGLIPNANIKIYNEIRIGVERYPYLLQDLNSSFKKDFIIVFSAMHVGPFSHPSVLRYADPEVQKEMVKDNIRYFAYANEEVKNEMFNDVKKQILKSAKDNRFTLENIAPEFQKDPEIVMAAIRWDPWAFKYADPELRKDPKFVMTVVKNRGAALRYANAKLKKDPEIVMAAVKNNSFALEYANAKLKKDPEIVMAAVKGHGLALEYADPELHKDREIVMEAVKECGHAIQYADPELQNDFDIAMAAIKNNYTAIRHIGPEPLKNPEIAMEAVKRSTLVFKCSTLVLKYIDPELRKNPKFIMNLIKEGYGATALEYADPELCRDPVIVMAAIKQNGLALEHAAPELQRNPEIVMEAIKEDGLALEYADPELQKNLNFVIAAIKEDANALEFADPELQKKLIKYNGYLFNCASEEVKKEISDNNKKGCLIANVEELENNSKFGGEALDALDNEDIDLTTNNGTNREIGE